MSLLIFLSLLTNCIAIHLAHIYEFISVSVERHIMRTISDTNLAFVVNKGLKRVQLTFKHINTSRKNKEQS